MLHLYFKIWLSHKLRCISQSHNKDTINKKSIFYVLFYVTKNFEPGWKLRSKVLNKDPSPLKTDLQRGILILETGVVEQFLPIVAPPPLENLLYHGKPAIYRTSRFSLGGGGYYRVVFPHRRVVPSLFGSVFLKF